jgi:hypothetical protein
VFEITEENNGAEEIRTLEQAAISKRFLDAIVLLRPTLEPEIEPRGSNSVAILQAGSKALAVSESEGEREAKQGKN